MESLFFWVAHYTLTGQVASCGAIAMYCLSLPIEVQFLLENIFIVGIIPGAPDVWTITHILISFTEMMNKFSPPGMVLPTYNHPLGVLTAARTLPLIASSGNS
jgi:hypothetical protein